MPSSVPDFGCETFVSISEEGFPIMFIGSAYSVLPRIAWGLIWSYFVLAIRMASSKSPTWETVFGIGLWINN